jgi:hypothetical protein
MADSALTQLLFKAIEIEPEKRIHARKNQGEDGQRNNPESLELSIRLTIQFL